MWISALGCVVPGMILTIGCADTLEPGELGQARIVGSVKGDPPRVLAPVSDLDGNVYVLTGAKDYPQDTKVYVGKTGGGWLGSCEVTKGDTYGPHGWVGRTRNQQWYWSGEALVSVSGDNGDCHALLDTDPVSGTNLAFIAVVPWVRDTPTQTSTVALIKGSSDRLPFQVRIDLRADLYTNVRVFEPPTAENVVVLGVGASEDRGEGYFLVRYEVAGQAVTEARFLDHQATTTGTVRLPLDPALPPYSIVGYLQANAKGLVTGLLSTNQLISFDRSGGVVRELQLIQAAGIHRWEEDLYLVGTIDNRPHIVPLNNDGSVGSPRVWTTSERVAASVAGGLDLIDDRTLPSRSDRWSGARSAIGAYPFLGPHSLDRYAEGTTGWLFAGPSYDAAGELVTLIAFAPVGVEYP